METIKRIGRFVFDSEASPIVLPIISALLFAGVVYLFLATAEPEAIQRLVEWLKTPQPPFMGVK